MIEITLYRFRIGTFNVTGKHFRFLKSRNNFRNLWPKKYNIDGRFILLLTMIISGAVIYINICKQSEDMIFCTRSFNSGTSMNVLGSCDVQSYISLSKLDLKILMVNKCQTGLKCQSIHVENYSVKGELKDPNFLARYVNGNGQKKKGILNMHLNIRSLKYKMHEVKNIVKVNGPHILGLSECELVKENIDEKSLKIPGYDVLYPSSWAVRGCARIIVYIKKRFQVQAG